MRFQEWREVYVTKMNVLVSGHVYDHNPQDVGDLALYLSTKIFGKYFGHRPVISDKILTAKDVEKLDKHKWITKFRPDEVTNPCDIVGTIELDYVGLPQRKSKKFMDAVRFFMDELRIKYGMAETESHNTAMRQDIDRSRGFGDSPEDIENWHKKVSKNNLKKIYRMKVPILHMPEMTASGPPSLLITTANMHHLVNRVLGFSRYKTERGYYIPCRELSSRLDELEGVKLPARSGNTYGGHFDAGYYITDIKLHLEVLYHINEWAIDHHHAELTIQ
jgi:hypothetical protein